MQIKNMAYWLKKNGITGDSEKTSPNKHLVHDGWNHVLHTNTLTGKISNPDAPPEFHKAPHDHPDKPWRGEDAIDTTK